MIAACSNPNTNCRPFSFDTSSITGASVARNSSSNSRLHGFDVLLRVLLKALEIEARLFEGALQIGQRSRAQSHARSSAIRPVASATRRRGPRLRPTSSVPASSMRANPALPALLVRATYERLIAPICVASITWANAGAPNEERDERRVRKRNGRVRNMGWPPPLWTKASPNRSVRLKPDATSAAAAT